MWFLDEKTYTEITWTWSSPRPIGKSISWSHCLNGVVLMFVYDMIRPLKRGGFLRDSEFEGMQTWARNLFPYLLSGRWRISE